MSIDHRTLCNYFVKQRNMLRLLVSYDTRWASQVAVVVKNLPASAGDIRNVGSIPGSGRSLGGGHATHSSTLPGESHGQRSLVDYSPLKSKT